MELVTHYSRLRTQVEMQTDVDSYASFIHQYRYWPKTSLSVEALATVLMSQLKHGESNFKS